MSKPKFIIFSMLFIIYVGNSKLAAVDGDAIQALLGCGGDGGDVAEK